MEAFDADVDYFTNLRQSFYFEDCDGWIEINRSAFDLPNLSGSVFRVICSRRFVTRLSLLRTDERRRRKGSHEEKSKHSTCFYQFSPLVRELCRRLSRAWHPSRRATTGYA